MSGHTPETAEMRLQYVLANISAIIAILRKSRRGDPALLPLLEGSVEWTDSMNQKALARAEVFGAVLAALERIAEDDEPGFDPRACARAAIAKVGGAS